MWVIFTLVAAVAWAGINVLDSFLVHRYNRSPFLLMWSQALFSMTGLLLMTLVVPVSSPWWWMLLIVGCTTYVADVVFFRTLHVLDVSVMNAAWAIQAVMQSIAGFLLFHERWTGSQWIGAALILGAAVALSFWHKHVSWGKTLMLLTVLAAVYIPSLVMQKAALLEGVPPLAVFFWMALPRESLAFGIPLSRPGLRTTLWTFLRQSTLPFFLWCGVIIVLFFIAVLSGVYAYSTGPISLIGVVGNVQPFLVLLFAATWGLLWPATAPKELVTRQSLTVKIASFAVAFAGLAILAKG